MISSIAIGAIGAGAWGRNIVRTLDGLGVLRMLAESDEELRAPLQAAHPSVEMVADHRELLQRPDIRAVTIATPACTHHALAREALLAGKDVFVEKPFTLTSAEAGDLVALADEHKRVLMVGHLLLYKPAIAFIQEFLQSGRLGRIFTMHQRRAKLGRARSVENALWSLGVHDVAALLHLAGAIPTGVQSVGHAGLQDGIEDDVHLHLRFADGCQAHLHTSWLWPEDDRNLTIVGSDGILVYDEKSETVTHVRKSIDASLDNVDAGRELVFATPAGFQPLRAELSHFLDCVITRESPRSDGRSGLEVVRVLEQASA